MSYFILHPDEKFTGTVRVGARNVEFENGKARTDFGPIVRSFTDAGYEVNENGHRTKAAKAARPTETPGDVLDD